ncbi:LysR substrate-binding domain-containing protein [Streptomyces chromofuscus]|uniref:LysR substrate-binding domain-containing protein n=1 Tax=Streptomyces chromofuscus TaxID=42881 RepID=UPI003570B052
MRRGASPALRRAGRLRIGSAASLALTVLPGLLRAFRERFPGVHLDLRGRAAVDPPAGRPAGGARSSRRTRRWSCCPARWAAHGCTPGSRACAPRQGSRPG